MSPPAAYLHVLAAFADFDGRASRADFWGFWLVHGGIGFILLIGSAIVADRAALGFVAGGMVFATYAALTFFPALSLTARRLHDIGRTSLWTSLLLVPVVGWGLLGVWLVQAGEAGPNGWGQPPD
ncbi:DUF805 domain-containing protein [Rubrivirga sp. IMCC43871]|uniref:DUF805 domain-containing protein n=1 Tax=Rubrivirga sp. IMCC43871 TaxID=3391575 RepID=UPI00398FDF2C